MSNKKKNNVLEEFDHNCKRALGGMGIGFLGLIVLAIVFGYKTKEVEPAKTQDYTNEDDKDIENKQITLETEGNNQKSIETRQTKIDYNTLSECVLLEKKDKTNQETEYFATKKIQDVRQEADSAILTISYINIKDDSKIIEFNTKESGIDNQEYSYTEIGPLSDYIFDNDYVQTDYTNEDVDDLLSKISSGLQAQKQDNFQKIIN